MGRDFDKWLSTFRKTVYGYDYYVDFEKAYRNVDDIRVELNILNSLIGSDDIEAEFEMLIARYPEVLKALPVLIAVRLDNIAKGFRVIDDLEEKVLHFKTCGNTPEEYRRFMRESGLFDLMANHLVRDLVDYVTGVEVGLDTNSRKNRGGKAMEKVVERHLKKIGCEYVREMRVADIEKRYDLSLSPLSDEGKASKRFDFVINSGGHIYALEVNFYASSGSKLNETARSFKSLAEDSKGIPNFTFIWITDGQGWMSARSSLEETFLVLDELYCLNDLDDGVLEELICKR